MENANSLAGKEYIDYLIDFLKGKKDADPPQQPKLQRKQLVFHELTKEECRKLTKTLDDEKMVYYFSVNDGFQVLVDSLYISTTCLPLLEKLLDKNTKLQEDFQKAHLYEALIDFLQSSNQNAQAKTLDYSDMLIILHMLESGSMNESVRMNLSDKKKIKDLFLVVINSIEIAKNKQLISSLVQFFSNLCFGQGKLRSMLAREDPKELMSLFKKVLDQIKIEQKFTAEDDEETENKAPNHQSKEQEFLLVEKRDRSVLKSSIYALIGNLCIDKTLRLKFASDQEQILTQVAVDFKQDVDGQQFDWKDMATKQLAIFINVSVEDAGVQTLVKADIFE